MRAPVAALVLSLAAAPLAAQATWTVDAAGGGDFTTLAAAVADEQVLDGDTLLVEPGTYGPFVTGKALTIIGRGGGSAPHVTGESRIDGAARATLAGLQLDELILLHIPGRATLEDVDVGHVFIQSFGLFNDSFRIEDCAEAVVSNSNLRGKTGNENWYESPGVHVRDSRVSLVNCTIQGGDGGDGDFGFPGQPGVLVLDGSVAVVAGCTITGGSGGGGREFCSSQGAYGIEIEHSTLWICGDGADVIAGGNDCPSFQKPEAVGGWYSQVTVSGVTLFAPALTSGLLATGTVVFPNPEQPFLFVGGDPTPGGVRRLNVTGPEGATALVFFSLQPLFADLPKLTSGPLWLDPSAPLIMLPLVLSGPHQPVTVNLPLPRQPAYAGITAWVQGFVAAGGGQFLDTNPASIVLRF